MMNAHAQLATDQSSRRGVRRPMRARRGFTLVEAILATLLGLMVISTVFALLIGVQRVERNSRVSYQQAIDMAAAQKALQRAFRQVVVSDGARPGIPAPITGDNRPDNTGTGSGSNSGRGNNTGSSAFGSRPAAGEAVSNASIAGSGERGSTSGGSDGKGGSGGGSSSEGGKSSAFGDAANGRRGMDEVSSRPRISLMGSGGMEILVAEPPVAIPGAVESGLQFAMTRGAFVLRGRENSGVGKQAAALGDEGAGGTDLVWEVYPLGDDPPASPTGERALGRVTLCRNVSSMRTQFYKTNVDTLKLEAVSTVQVTEKRELPAYAEVELVLQGGRKVRWLFEIGWTTGVEPRSSEQRFAGSDDDEAPEAAAAPGDAPRANEERRSGFGSRGSRSSNATPIDKGANREAIRGSNGAQPGSRP